MSVTLGVMVVALAFLIVSFILALIQQGGLAQPLLWAVWSLAIIIVFGVGQTAGLLPK